MERKKLLIIMAALGVGLLFSALRLYKIDSSYLFFGDPGRDLFVLQQWLQTGKPPLLGPQTSALPFNQSAVYFYMLFPFFLAFNHSLLSTIYASLIIHLIVFASGVYLLRKRVKLLISWLLIWVLFSIHPQFVAQHRYIWNPSFVGISIAAAFYFFLEIVRQKKFNNWQLAGFSISIALATAFSYSAIPALMAFVILGIILLKKQRLKFLPSLPVALALVNLPTVAFELRHGFVLTKMMLYQEKLAQSGSSIYNKLANLEEFVLAANGLSAAALLILFAVLVGARLYLRRQKLNLNHPLPIALILLTLTLAFTLMLPVSIHAHYIFAITTLAFIAVSLLNWRLSVLFVLAAAVVWLNPTQLGSYFKPAFRSIGETQRCARRVCEAVADPLFVSVQAGYHPYHNAYEFRYLLGEAGCQVMDLDTQPGQAEYMAVFADRSTYEHGRTAYNELTQFGESTESAVINCTPDLRVHLLEKL